MPAGLRAGLIHAPQPRQYLLGRQKNSYELPLPGKHCPGGKYRCQRVKVLKNMTGVRLSFLHVLIDATASELTRLNHRLHGFS